MICATLLSLPEAGMQGVRRLGRARGHASRGDASLGGATTDRWLEHSPMTLTSRGRAANQN